jgi:hypothetical protein
MVVARGIATVEQVMSALERQRVSGGHLGAHLIALGVLTSLELSSLLVEQNDARTALPFCERTLARGRASSAFTIRRRPGLAAIWPKRCWLADKPKRRSPKAGWR